MSLASFHPACRAWFESRFGPPTEAQAQAWPAIQEGRHTLISAPTGSGKTLAAFFVAIDSLVQKGLRQQNPDGVQVLYVSPLKALSNDIHRNLEVPLNGIAEQLHLHGEAPVDIRAAVRTGDTPTAERQRMAKNPPHILVTTPESLYLLLTSASGRRMLATVETLIVDEIHAMLGDKRGSHLALSIERLQRLVLGNGGRHLQRIGLSATQKPITRVARYLVGTRPGEDDTSLPTDCAIVDTGHRRKLDLRVEVPGSPLTAVMANEVWEELYQRLVQLVQEHETTLVFVNTRRLSERLALALADRLGEDCVCSHHGSMSKDHRFAAEQKLKEGQLKVLVATASMELGIDIGSVDLVVQFSSPKSIATFLQRVGRSGHSIHGTPKGILFPLTRDDLVECTALVNAIHHGELDMINMPECPLDILSQQIVAEVSASSPEKTDGNDEIDGWDLDALYELFGRAYPYRNLQRRDFDTIVKMLADGYSGRRGRRGAHLHLDAVHNRVRARRGANLLAITNGGAIPDMFDYQVVLDPEDIVVGTLNEDFALEALPGDVFTLGTHSWQLLRVDGLKVRVRDAQGMQATIPFWLGEGPGRTRELSDSVSRLRQQVAELLLNDSANAAVQWLVDEVGLPREGAVQLTEYLQSGMQALGCMPSRETIAMERFFDEVGDMHVVIHSPFGSRLNRAWGLALRKRFCRTFNFELQAAANEDSIVISLGSVHSFVLEEVFRYLQSTTVKDVLVQAMLDAPMFEVRWRWNATRFLAIQRNRNGKRVPPQFQRMDAEDLIAHVFPDQIACQENITGKREVPDHPLVNQTVHDCLTEAMDIDELLELVGKIERQELNLVAKDLREPSPFAQEIINARPYAFLDDAPFEERRTNAIRNRSWADPAEAKDFSLLDQSAIDRVREEAWPVVTNEHELHDALITLSYMTTAEVEQYRYQDLLQLLQDAGRVCSVPGSNGQLWIALESAPRYQMLYKDFTPGSELPNFLREENWTQEDALRELVRGRLDGLGPVQSRQLAQETGLEQSRIDQALIALEVEGFAFQGQFSPALRDRAGTGEGKMVEWCERRLLQRIHRYTIDTHRKSIKPVSLEAYVAYLFDYHQLVVSGDSLTTQPGIDGQTQLQRSLSLLDGVAAPAASWEQDILPARIRDYDPNWLDVLCISGRVTWGRYSLPVASQRNGARKKNATPVKSTPMTIATRQNLDLWQALARAPVDDSEQITLGAVAERIRQDLQQHGASFFDQVQSRTGLLRTQLEEGLAELVSAGRVCSDSYTGLRALLTPNHKKAGGSSRRGRRAMFGVEDAGRWSLLDTFEFPQATEEGNKRPSRHWDVLDEEQLERLVAIYLQRWGVVSRSVIDREALVPPWRVLLLTLRKMELRGVVRGGRFIAGVGGEQFAYPSVVDELRKYGSGKKSLNEGYFTIAATDPLNLLNIIQPTHKLPRLLNNRVLYQGGIPVAMMESGKVSFLRELPVEKQWQAQKLLQQRNYPVRLRAYLGR